MTTFTVPTPIKYLIGICLGVGGSLNVVGLINDNAILKTGVSILPWHMTSVDPELAGGLLIIIALIVICLDIILPEEEGKIPATTTKVA